ncbi:heme ABC exporter ATP-binding protein CcmA [Pelagivirga sediminicola]|uniref:Heme ABC exporter ATP-binding protein CcmA n=1 Tax=Pelagivirga sediminicola TaxID=2170575 RepID=A0A2T7G5V1_9RHOB|nr:heme ABC exporter ATP-binding protein CcmA [Pelagivirga sediminicola]PVA09795.1 heme ABC exporter ATP-binding protein CcmA [Pelagivirga sediminicola]
MSLSAHDLSVSRGGIAVLEGVTFTLDPGRALILRGPNGSGKTTLLRTLAGLQPPLRGRVQAPPEARVYAGHADGIKAALTARENLSFWADIFGGGDVHAALAAFELEGLAERPAGAMSAGQKRRLGLARLIVAGREIWLLDEPTVSLDAPATAMFARTVRAHLAAGGSAVMATHIDLGLDEAEVMDVAPFKARAAALDGFDEAFL